MNSRPPSLVEIATKQCINYCQFITDVGDIPFWVVKPILARLSPEQLTLVESNSQHIMPASDILWRDHIIRTFKDRKLPDSNFRETYHRFCHDKEAQLDAATERLKMKQKQYNLNKKATSVVALKESELPFSQRGPPQAAFKSRSMQSVAKRMSSNYTLRKAPATKFSQFDNIKPLSNSLSITPSNRPASPSVSSSLGVASKPTKMNIKPMPSSATASTISGLKRKRTSPLFHPRRS